jgi:hypothetical protein
MTDKANQIIEWSKSVTDRTKNEYDPIARQLFAINLFKTDSGFSFNLVPADFEAIERYIDRFDRNLN